MNYERRDVLKLAGATAAVTTTGLAGCLDTIGLGGSDEPGYSKWLTTDEDGAVGYAYIDWGTLEELDDEDDDVEFVDDDEGEDDPMYSVPTDAAGGILFLLGLGLAEHDLGGLLEEEDESDLDSSADGILFVNDAIVFTGEFDVEEIDEILTDDGSERTDEIGDYDVYTSAEGDDGATALSGDALVVSFDSDDTDDALEIIRSPVEAAQGETERATDESDEFEWLLETAGSGLFVAGFYGEPDDDEVEPDDDELEELSDAQGIVSSITVESTEEASGTLAAVADEPDEEELEALLGSSADEASVEVDGDRVTASASWDRIDD